MKRTAKNLTAKFFLAAALALLILPLRVTAELGLDGVEENPAAAHTHQSAGFGYEVTETESLKGFYSVLNRILVKRGWREEDLCDRKDVVIDRILREYGSIFIVSEKALPPPVCMFTNAVEVENFQRKVGFVSAEIAGTRIELQAAAMESLLKARAEALQKGLDITPRDGAEAARRGFDDTIRLWKSRFEPACEHWKNQGRLSAEQVEKLKALPVKQQIREVLTLEKQGVYFNKFFNNSILYSVAAPGTSQHLSMLALDVNEFENAEVRKILESHGWFQTVRNDTPHFTFLGRKKEDLRELGLKEVKTGTGKFWVPDVNG